MNSINKFELDELPYDYDALEPLIDKLRMEIHYGKHHKVYYDNFVAAIKGTEIESMNVMDIFKDMSKFSLAVRKYSGGYYNHTFYWKGTNDGSDLPTGEYWMP